MDAADARIPVTLVAGFLGAGKTTLVRRILTADHGLNIAVLVNDFGALNIDAHLIGDVAEDVLSLANGCLCCSVANGMNAALTRLAARRPRPGHVLVECSGVAEPGRVAAGFRHGANRASFRLDAVVTLVDLTMVGHLPVEMRDLADAQIEAADIVLLNKADLVPSGAAEAFRRDRLFPDSRALETIQADAPLALLFDAPVRDGARRATLPRVADSDDLFESFAWTSDGTVAVEALRRVIAALPASVFRAKGVFRPREWPGEDVVLQLVGGRAEWSRRKAAAERCEAVFIGLRGAMAVGDLRRALDACC